MKTNAKAGAPMTQQNAPTEQNAPAEKMAPASKSDQHRATEKGESDSKQQKSQKMDKGAATGAAHKGPADAADNADAKPKSMIKAGESGGRGRHVHQLDSVVVKFFLALPTSGHFQSL